MIRAYRPEASFVLSHPAHLVAFGFGAGMVPLAPGTAGTLLAWAVGIVFVPAVPAPLALAVLLALFALGIWACGLTGRHLGVSDHGSMVWDEFVAFLVVLVVLPPAFGWQAAAFALFRSFDIVKPPPIRWLERRYRGGFGVRVDDLLAAGYTLLVLALVKRFVF